MYIAVFIVTPTVGILYKEFYRSFTVSCLKILICAYYTRNTFVHLFAFILENWDWH